MLILITKHKNVFFEKYIYQILNMTSRRQKTFKSLLPRECMSRYFFENFFHVCNANTSKDKSTF